MGNELAKLTASRVRERVAKVQKMLVAMEVISSMPKANSETLDQLSRLADAIYAEFVGFDEILHPARGTHGVDHMH